MHLVHVIVFMWPYENGMTKQEMERWDICMRPVPYFPNVTHHEGPNFFRGQFFNRNSRNLY